MINNFDKARIINEALPYIQDFFEKVMVVKIGGTVLDQSDLKFFHDLVLLKYIGIKVVLVHGGGAQVSNLLNRLGKEAKFIDGLRVTDSESMKITEMVLSGLINKEIVAGLQYSGGKAVGLSGKDGGTVMAKINPNQEHLGMVGEISAINLDLINKLMDDSYLPVLSSVASDGKTGSLNINADHFATEIAIALKAEKLIFLSDVNGVLRDSQDNSSLISKVHIGEIDQLIKEGVVRGGMIPKLHSAKKSIESGIHYVHFLSGLIPHSLLVELFTEEGIGTQIYR